MKKYSKLLRIREMQIKQHWYLISHLWDWQQFKNITTYSIGKSLEKQALSYIAGGI